MSISKVLKGLMLGLLVFMLSACGGGSSAGGDANSTTVPTTQALAIQAIATYAQEGGTAPSIEVYATAEVSGIDATNLADANTLVESLVYEDVDTVEEIQALVDGLHTNTAPVATAQSITLDEDTSKTITFAGTDVDGDTLSYTVTTQPSHGTITGNTYTPNANYFGSDSFGFVANDGTVDSAEATVSITVTAVNDAPVATAQTLTTDEDTAKTFTLSGTDVEGDTLTYTITKQPSHGTISGNTYTPNANYFGADSLSFVANDGTVDSSEATASITITAVNDAPVASAQTLTTAEDTPITFSATDADADKLTYTITTQPSHGTIVNNTYTPNANYFGSDSFGFMANDGKVDSSEVTVSISITAVNDAPILSAIADVTKEEDSAPFEVTLSAVDVDSGNTLTYSASATDASKVVVSVSGSTLTITPQANAYGEVQVSVIVTDSTVRVKQTFTVTLTPVEDIPIAIAQSITLEEDNTTKVTLAGTDPDNDYIRGYTITTFPQHGYLTGNYKTWTYHPNQNYYGADSFSFTVNDGKADSLPATIDITVTPVNNSPFAYNGNYKIAVNSSVTVELNASDVDNTPNEMTYAITSQPTNGDYDEPTKTYTPATDFTGVDSFTYTATDPDGLISTGTVYVNVGIVAPYITRWKTDNEGNTTNTQIKIGTYSSSIYNFTVEWGDGRVDENITQSIVHDYGTAGTYTVKISGEYPHPFSGSYTSGVDNYKNFDTLKLLSIEQWGDMVWKSMSFAFLKASNMTLHASDVPNLSAVTNMSSMFNGATAFNQDISTWDVSVVTNMRAMFDDAHTFSQDLSTWDVSAVTDMRWMFSGASSFNQELKSWDVSAVTNMYAMFNRAHAFNQDLSAWDVSAVTSMGAMFDDARAFNQDLSTWNVSTVTDMSVMFSAASAFNQGLSSWDISSVTTMDKMFNGVTLSTPNYDALLQGWSAQNLQSGVTFDGGYSQYSSTSQAARNTLTNDYNWTVTDDGVAP